jgi:Ca2+ transporting ATPase
MKCGRNIFDSIRKFLQFQLTASCCTVVLVFAGCVFQKKSPLSISQILWVNLIADIFSSLSFANEPLSDKILERSSINLN